VVRWVMSFIAAACLSAASIAETPDIEGLWILDSGDVALEIAERDGHYEGTIVWLAEAVYPPESRYPGEVKRDLYNPDPEMRHRPLLGLRVLWGFTYSGENRWEKGSVYDADSGKRYSAAITLDGADKLTARAYVGVQLLGKSITARRWTPEEAAKALGTPEEAAAQNSTNSEHS
jgi:uncharacterized protein (DUF2147 family)